MLPIEIVRDHRFIDIRPKTVYRDGAPTDVQASDIDGVPLYTAVVKVFGEDEDGDRVAQRIRVTVPSKTEPKINGDKVRFEGLSVGIANGALYFKATAIQEAEPNLDDILDEGN